MGLTRQFWRYFVVDLSVRESSRALDLDLMSVLVEVIQNGRIQQDNSKTNFKQQFAVVSKNF